MKFVKLLLGVAVLYLLSALGNALSSALALPLPGAIIAFIILLVWCLWRGHSHHSLDDASKSLTLILPLLIMPSSIGIMEHWALIKAEWLAILIAISASLLLTLFTTPWLVARVERSFAERSESVQPDLDSNKNSK